MYRIMICDDEAEARRECAALVSRLTQLLGEPCQFEYASSPEEALRLRQKEGGWNLIFLDILMDGPAGLRLAEQLRQIGDETDIVFVTSCAEYALEGYRSYPVNFLVKPLTKESLLPVLKHCLSRWRQEPALRLDLGEGGKEAIQLKEICYIEVFRRELVVHCATRVVKGMGSLSDLEKQLPCGRFYRCHRSFLINFDWVSGIGRYYFMMKAPDRVPIAIRNYPEAQQKWLEYFS